MHDQQERGNGCWQWQVRHPCQNRSHLHLLETAMLEITRACGDARACVHQVQLYWLGWAGERPTCMPLTMSSRAAVACRWAWECGADAPGACLPACSSHSAGAAARTVHLCPCGQTMLSIKEAGLHTMWSRGA